MRSVDLAVDVFDNENADVVIVESGGDTLLTDSATPGPADRDDYTIRLTRAPAPGETVSIAINTGGLADVFGATDGAMIDRLSFGEIGKLDSAVFFTGELVVDGGARTLERTDRGSFLDEGFAAGQLLQIGGSSAGNDSGSEDFYVIDSVSADGRTITLAAGGALASETTDGMSLSRAERNGLFIGDLAFDVADNTIDITGAENWLDAGFLEGQRIEITAGGVTENYKIAIIGSATPDGPDNVMLLTAENDLTAFGTGEFALQDVRVVRVAPMITFDETNWFQDVTVTLAADPNYDLPPGRENAKIFPVTPHLTSALDGPLAVEGGFVVERGLARAVLLPGEVNRDFLAIDPQPDELAEIDTLNIFNDSSREDDQGVLTSTNLSGFGMAGSLDFGDQDFTETAFGEPLLVPGGITFGTIALDANGDFVTDGDASTIEILNFLMGAGNDTLVIEGTLRTDAIHGGVTAVHGGGNRTADDGDTIIVDGGGGADSLLVIYGDTSQDGVW